MVAEKRNTEVRRDELARAALALIAEQGMKGLRVAGVARKAGLVPSGLYRHYRNKNDLLDAILDFIQARFAANVQAVSRLSSPAPKRLHALLMKHIDLIRENRSIPLVVFSAEVYSTSALRRAKLLAIIESYLAEVAALIAQGQREGSIRRNLDPAAVAVLFLGLVQPSAILWHLSAGQFDVFKQAAASWPLFCRAILQPSPKGARS